MQQPETGCSPGTHSGSTPVPQKPYILGPAKALENVWITKVNKGPSVK